ncbi:hypothetical protein HpBT060_09610 [Helicobacter pylori]
MQDFSSLLLKLQEYWKNQGCLVIQPYDIPAGAGTFHPATLLIYYLVVWWKCSALGRSLGVRQRLF